MNDNEYSWDGQQPEPQILDGSDAPAAPQPPREAIPRMEAPRRSRRQSDEPVRRVGSFTLGIALIITGLVIVLSLAVPNFQIVTAAKLAPLVLVALGVEVLWANAHRGQAKLKYDFLSMFVCFILICGSLGVATIPVLTRYYGPDRQHAEARLESQLQQRLYETLPQDAVTACSTYVSLTGPQVSENVTLDQLNEGNYVRADLTLSGAFADKTAFAESCHALLPGLKEAGVKQVTFTAENGDERWYLSVEGVFQMNNTAQQLESSVRHQVKYWYDSDSYDWLDDDVAAARDAQDDQILQEQLDNEYTNGYDEGHAQGYEEAWQEAEAAYGQQDGETA